MFDEESGLGSGVTIKVYRFNSGISDKPLVSMLVRMNDKVEQGNTVIGPIIEARKKEARVELEQAKSKKPWLFASKAKKDLFKSRMNMLQSRYANPLFDFDKAEGDAVLYRIVEGLKSQGLTEKVHSQKSNGDMTEEIYLFS